MQCLHVAHDLLCPIVPFCVTWDSHPSKISQHAKSHTLWAALHVCLSICPSLWGYIWLFTSFPVQEHTCVRWGAPWCDDLNENVRSRFRYLTAVCVQSTITTAVTWEEDLGAGLSRSGLPVGMPVEDCLAYAKWRVKIQSSVDSSVLQIQVLNYTRVEKLNEVLKSCTHHYSRLWTGNMMWPAVFSSGHLDTLQWWLWAGTVNWNKSLFL